MKKAEPFEVWIDSREKCPPVFPEGVTLRRVTMGEADFTTEKLQGIGVIERKSVADWGQSITWSRERFDNEMIRLKPYRWKTIVVEGELSEVYRTCNIHVHAVIGTVAAFLAWYDCPTMFMVNAHGAGRLIAGILRRWEKRLEEEAAEAADALEKSLEASIVAPTVSLPNG